MIYLWCLPMERGAIKPPLPSPPSHWWCWLSGLFAPAPPADWQEAGMLPCSVILCQGCISVWGKKNKTTEGREAKSWNLPSAPPMSSKTSPPHAPSVVGHSPAPGQPVWLVKSAENNSHLGCSFLLFVCLLFFGLFLF